MKSFQQLPNRNVDGNAALSSLHRSNQHGILQNRKRTLQPREADRLNDFASYEEICVTGFHLKPPGFVVQENIQSRPLIRDYASHTNSWVRRTAGAILRNSTARSKWLARDGVPGK